MADYYVLDSRARSLVERSGDLNKRIDHLDEDCERFVMEVGTAKECCTAVNNQDYGSRCVVANEEWRIMWEWNDKKTGKWKHNGRN